MKLPKNFTPKQIALTVCALLACGCDLSFGRNNFKTENLPQAPSREETILGDEKTRFLLQRGEYLLELNLSAFEKEKKVATLTPKLHHLLPGFAPKPLENVHVILENSFLIENLKRLDSAKYFRIQMLNGKYHILIGTHGLMGGGGEGSKCGGGGDRGDRPERGGSGNTSSSREEVSARFMSGVTREFDTSTRNFGREAISEFRANSTASYERADRTIREAINPGGRDFERIGDQIYMTNYDPVRSVNRTVESSHTRGVLNSNQGPFLVAEGSFVLVGEPRESLLSSMFRNAALRRLEQERIAEERERAETERIAREERERREAEQRARAEAERIAREEREQREAEQRERERIYREEEARIAREEREEQERLDRERAARAEVERLAREKREREEREEREFQARMAERTKEFARQVFNKNGFDFERYADLPYHMISAKFSAYESDLYDKKQTAKFEARQEARRQQRREEIVREQERARNFIRPVQEPVEAPHNPLTEVYATHLPNVKAPSLLGKNLENYNAYTNTMSTAEVEFAQATTDFQEAIDQRNPAAIEEAHSRQVEATKKHDQGMQKMKHFSTLYEKKPQRQEPWIAKPKATATRMITELELAKQQIREAYSQQEDIKRELKHEKNILQRLYHNETDVPPGTQELIDTLTTKIEATRQSAKTLKRALKEPYESSGEEDNIMSRAELQAQKETRAAIAQGTQRIMQRAVDHLPQALEMLLHEQSISTAVSTLGGPYALTAYGLGKAVQFALEVPEIADQVKTVYNEWDDIPGDDKLTLCTDLVVDFLVSFAAKNGKRLNLDVDTRLGFAKEIEKKLADMPVRHHVASNKHLTRYTQEFEEIIRRYDLKLNQEWNIVKVPFKYHYSKHPIEYHEHILKKMKLIDMDANGNRERFLTLFAGLREEIISQPILLNKHGW